MEVQASTRNTQKGTSSALIRMSSWAGFAGAYFPFRLPVACDGGVSVPSRQLLRLRTTQHSSLPLPGICGSNNGYLGGNPVSEKRHVQQSTVGEGGPSQMTG